MSVLIYRFLSLFLSVCQMVLFAHVLLSWVPTLQATRLGRFIHFLAEPLFRPLRGFRLIIGPLDLTVFLLVWLLQWLEHFLFRILVG